MDDLIRVAALVAVTVLSIQMGSVFQLGVAVADAQSHEPCQANCFRFDQVLSDFCELGLDSSAIPISPVLDHLDPDSSGNPAAPLPPSLTSN